MIFRLKTSKKTQEIFQELENRTNYKPYTLVKHAIAWSLKENTSVADYERILIEEVNCCLTCIIMLEIWISIFFKC